MPRISVAKVAQLAKVSPATVSRILSGQTGVSEAKVERVRAIIAKLGAAPTRRPRKDPADRPARSVLLAIVDPDNLHPLSVELYQTILHAEHFAREHGYTFTFARVYPGERLPDTVRDGAIDGLLLAGRDLPPDIESFLGKLPTVWLTSHHEDKKDVSMAGNEDVGRLVAQYFLDRGHRSLGYLQIPGELSVHAARYSFYEFTALRAGAVAHRYQASLPEGPATQLADWEAIARVVDGQIHALARTPARPTALFVPVGPLTGVVYTSLRRHGLEPGRDVAVACCDLNMPMLMGLSPRPAILSINPRTIARRAVLELAQRMEKPSAEEERVRIFIEPELTPGEATPA